MHSAWSGTAPLGSCGMPQRWCCRHAQPSQKQYLMPLMTQYCSIRPHQPSAASPVMSAGVRRRRRTRRSFSGSSCGSISRPRLHQQIVAAQSDRFAGVDLSPLLASPPDSNPGGPPPQPGPEDQEKEESRKFRRTVFDFERWREHRSTSRYTRHILGILGSRIVRGLAGPLAIVAAISVFVGMYESAREAGYLPGALQSISVANTEPFNLSSFALSLLLVFRTNSSYARWEEARKVWGGVVNRSRDLVRQAESWIPEAESELTDMVQRWTIAFSRALQTHLREDSDLQHELQNILPDVELASVLESNHRPNHVLSVLSCAIEEAHVPDCARVRMDENLTFFADAVGACERILKTPIPLTYTRHTSRFLVIWLTFMPFTLWHACGWGTVPASVAIAFLLLGIEEIGVQIEEPFAILPLENMCATITRDCMELHERKHQIRQLIASRTRPMYLQGSGPADLRPKHERRMRYYSPRWEGPDGTGNGGGSGSMDAIDFSGDADTGGGF